MTKEEIAQTIQRYNARLGLHGYDPKSLGWGEKDRAFLRFEILLSQWRFEGATVLDFGCGFGDLLQYARTSGRNFKRYIGVDINPEFIKIAKERNPDADFICADVFDLDESDIKCDYVLTSGVFNHKYTDNYGFIQKCFEKFNSIAGLGFSSNFLSDKVSYELDYTFHSNPGKVVELSYAFSNNIILRNDYMPFEFTIFVNKASQVDNKYTVYEEFKKYV